MAEHPVRSPVPGAFYRMAGPDTDSYANESGSRFTQGVPVMEVGNE